MKVVYKYATGQEIPDGAVYLCTKVETFTQEGFVKNFFVWHYFLVKVEKKEEK